MKRLAAITLAALACLTGQADAVQVRGNPAFQTWADRSLIATPPVRVFARNRQCPFFEPSPGNVIGCAKRWTVWVPLGYRISRGMFFHELGHVVQRQILPWNRLEPEEFANRYARCAMWPDVRTPAGWCGRIGRRVLAPRIVRARTQ